MTLPPVYLHALGMVNALGGDVASIVPALAAARAELAVAVPVQAAYNAVVPREVPVNELTKA